MPPAAAPRVRRRRAWARVLVTLAIATVLWFHTWSAWVANAFGDWGEWDYYRLLVRGFRQGHLHLDYAPPRELIALADPYDPEQNAPYRLGDASYYKGRYYLYFGPTPAVTLMLPYALLTGRELPTGAAIYLFYLVTLGAMTGLWLAIRARYFPNSAAWIGAAGILGLGFATHLLTLLRRPMWWELAIVGGIAFTWLALVAVYRALHGSRPRWAMAAAGLCLGLAVGSRPVCLFATPILLAPLWRAWRERRGESGPEEVRRGSTWRQLALAAAVPLAACGVALMAYNYARFDNPFEFGQNYQLSGAYESKLPHFRFAYVPHNAAAVFFQPLRWTWEFPFVQAWADTADVPGHMGSEEIAGLLRTFPFLALAVLVPLCWRGRMQSDAHAVRMTIGAMAGYFLPVCFTVLCFFATTARYIADFASPLALLAACGLLGLERQAQALGNWPGRLGWRAIGVPLVLLSVAVTVPMAMLLSFDYHNRAPMREDPPRWAWHERTWADAIARVGLWFGWYSGPIILPVKLRAQPPGTIETLWRSADPEVDERVLVEHAEQLKVRFGYVRRGMAARWGAAVPCPPRRPHRVELQVPSLHGPATRWVHGFRRHEAYRERSAVAIWLDGERVLALIARPLPPGAQPGGAVPAEFSGRAGTSTRRLLREDEIPLHGAGTWVVSGPAAALEPQPLPLVTTGREEAANALSLARVGAGTGRLIFERTGRLPLCSPDFALPSTERLTIEIEQAPVWPWSATEDEEQPLSVWINGRLAWETRVRWHASDADEVFLARNQLGVGTSAPDAPGWARSAPWPRAIGGTMRFRLVFPEPLAAGEPLIAIGAPFQTDTVGVRGAGAPNTAEMFFEHFPAPVATGARFTLIPGRLETVDITLPSFRPDRFGEPAAGDVMVRVNRETVLGVRTACHPTFDTGSGIGRNRFAGRLCASWFRGWLLDTRWTGTMDTSVPGQQ